MSDDVTAKVDSAEAWNDFCDLLKKAGDVVRRKELETSTFDRGEGLRYLARLLQAGLDSFLENPGAEYPYFRRMAANVKMGLDNPDNFYVSASVKTFPRPGWVTDTWSIGSLTVEVFDTVVIATTVVALAATTWLPPPSWSRRR